MTHRRRQSYSRGSTCCPIICAKPAPNVKCCPILGIRLNINRHYLINYNWFILLSQRLTNHAAQSARSICKQCIPIIAYSQRSHRRNWLTCCMREFMTANDTRKSLADIICCCRNRLQDAQCSYNLILKVSSKAATNNTEWLGVFSQVVSRKRGKTIFQNENAEWLRCTRKK